MAVDDPLPTHPASASGGAAARSSTETGATAARTSAGGAFGSTASVTRTSPGGTTSAQCPDELVSDIESMSLHGNLATTEDRYTPSCRALPGTPDFVAAFSAPESGTYVIDTLGSDIDTVLAVYAGLCGSDELACNDEDEHISHQSRLVLDLEQAQTITIVVDGYRGQTGNILLNVSPPSNLIDSFVSASLPVTTVGNTKGLRDRLTSSCNSKLSSSDYVILFESQRSGTFEFRVTSTEFKPILSLRDGGPSGKEIACADGGSSSGSPSVWYALSAGRKVAVIIDGYDGSFGEFKLSIEPVSDPGSCAVASATRTGCIDPEVTACVCERIPDCCFGPWQALCATSDPSLACGTANR
ncbi:MAG TPA: hypothetical protein VIV60_30440 [Polyangiaceae bacterium]